MGISVRHYIVHEDGALRRVSRRVVDGLIFGKDAIPDYAGTKQKVAQVVVESDQGKPIRICDVRGQFWTFDEAGQIHHGLQEGLAEAMDMAYGSKKLDTGGRVVDLVPEIKKKALRAKREWTVTAELLDRIAADLWPGIHGPAPDVATVKGRAPRKPALSYGAKHALQEIEGDVDNIKFRMHRLNEHSLKGLEFEAHRIASFEDTHLWRGVAEEAKLQRQILAAHRTGKGEWYAVLEATQVEERIIANKVGAAHVKCDTREQALEAGRRLMLEKADWLRAQTTLEVAIYSALEWRPEEDES